MKSILITLSVCIVLLISVSSCVETEYWVYVSSANDEDNSGIGIYEWNASDGNLQLIENDKTVSSSSYLAIDDQSNRLYNINGSGIQSFQVNNKNGSLTLINEVSHTGNGPCYISISTNRQYLMVAYYSSGSIVTYELNDKGEIGNMISQIVHEGSSVNKDRQEKAHAHMVIPAQKGNLIFVTDLGMDKILTYRIDDKGILLPEPVSTTVVNPGNGPRHLTFHPTKPFVYVLAELTGDVLTYEYDDEKGITKKIGEVHILPEDFNEFNKSADIHISQNGKYLYASNRGDNSIAVCEINAGDGSLALIKILSCGGVWPRAFEIEPSGQFLLVANKRSDAISVMDIDSDTGLFEKISETKTSPAPQCIKFLKK